MAPSALALCGLDAPRNESESLPKQVTEFAKFEGTWNDQWLETLVENAMRRDRINVSFKCPSTTYAGFATIGRGGGEWKMRVVVHDDLDGPSRFGVLCHEETTPYHRVFRWILWVRSRVGSKG